MLIIHGRGRDNEAHTNIVRSYLAQWLQQFNVVQAYCTSHGDASACDVDLPKSAKAREESRERHAKHRR